MYNPMAKNLPTIMTTRNYDMELEVATLQLCHSIIRTVRGGGGGHFSCCKVYHITYPAGRGTKIHISRVSGKHARPVSALFAIYAVIVLRINFLSQI